MAQYKTSEITMKFEHFQPKIKITNVFLIVVLITIGIVRIYSTYNVFWQTWDEPAHIAAGMEWLDSGRYTYEPLHPPLARVMSALLLYINGIRSIGKEEMYAEGNAILFTNNSYEHNLTLARLGILPFFIIASLIVTFWAYKYGGMVTAFLSVLLFTSLPPILAHSGTATLDMANAALVAAALFAIFLWLRRPTLSNGILVGIASGMAFLTKLSSLGFLVVAGSFVIVTYYASFYFQRSFSIKNKLSIRRRFSTLIIALIVGFFVIWAGYRFSFGPLLEINTRPHQIIDKIVGNEGPLRDTAYYFVESFPFPAPELLEGIIESPRRNSEGHLNFLLGDIRTQGWWYFYPFLLLYKTPLSFLLLVIIGIFYVVKEIVKKHGDIQLLIPTVAALGVLAVGMLSSVNNGIRQIIAIYPILAIMAGYGGTRLLSLPRSGYRYIGIVLFTILLSWQLTSSFYAHPDYLAYFNELAGKHPENIALDGDLDWGQDLKRLSNTLRIRGINEFFISYHGSHGINFDLFNFPPRRELIPNEKVFGWIAISVYRLQLGARTPPYDQFLWLKQYQPIERVGKSIWLYFIPHEKNQSSKDKLNNNTHERKRLETSKRNFSIPNHP